MITNEDQMLLYEEQIGRIEILWKGDSWKKYPWCSMEEIDAELPRLERMKEEHPEQMSEPFVPMREYPKILTTEDWVNDLVKVAERRARSK